MAAFPKEWRQGHIPVSDGPGQHPELIAWEAEEDRLRASKPSCTCYDVATMEYAPTPCAHCRTVDGAA